MVSRPSYGSDGVLGKIRKVWVEYPQGWLSRLSERGVMLRRPGVPIRKMEVRPLVWAILEHMPHIWPNILPILQDQQARADLNIMVEGRMLDDDGIITFDNGIAGVYGITGAGRECLKN